MGLSKCEYDCASESDNPCYCLFCLQPFYNNVITELKDQISTLTSKLNQSPVAADYQPSSNLSSSNNTPPAALPLNSGANTPAVSTKQDSARKFNVVLFGIKECSKGTKKMERNILDLNNATDILMDLDNSVHSHSIRDTIRFGKYKLSGRPRSMLVTLNRSSKVNSIL